MSTDEPAIKRQKTDDIPPANDTQSNDVDEEEKECLICLCPLQTAFVTPCNHEFCYVCLSQLTSNSTTYDNINNVSVKGFSCPLCRTFVSLSALTGASMDKSSFLNQLDKAKDSYVWQYGGRDSRYWMYSDALSAEIESAYLKFSPYESSFHEISADQRPTHPKIPVPVRYFSTYFPSGQCDCNAKCRDDLAPGGVNRRNCGCCCAFCYHRCLGCDDRFEEDDYDSENEEEDEDDDGDNDDDGNQNNNGASSSSDPTVASTSVAQSDVTTSATAAPTISTDTTVSDATMSNVSDDKSTSPIPVSSAIDASDDTANNANTSVVPDVSAAAVDAPATTDAPAAADAPAASTTPAAPVVCTQTVTLKALYEKNRPTVQASPTTVKLWVPRHVISLQSIASLSSGAGPGAGVSAALLQQKPADVSTVGDQSTVSASATGQLPPTIQPSNPLGRRVSTLVRRDSLVTAKPDAVDANPSTTTNTASASVDDGSVSSATNTTTSTSSTINTDPVNVTSTVALPTDKVEVEVDKNLPFTTVFVGADEYGIDFINMVQFPVARPHFKRAIRRAEKNSLQNSQDVKGVSGIKFRQ